MLAYMALQTSSEMHIWAPSMQFESIFMAGAVLLHRFPGVLLSMLLQTFAKSVGCLKPRSFALGAGVCSVCLCEDCNASQVDGAQDEIVGTYVEQADLVLRVTPAARTDSILRLDPEAIVAGTANISFQGFFVSRGSYVALSSSPTCQPGWDANILRLCLCLCLCELLFWFCVGGPYFVSDATRRLCLLGLSRPRRSSF